MCKKKNTLAYIFLKKLLHITHDYNLTNSEIAFGYIRSIHGISSVVIGIENMKQLNL